VAEVAVMGPSPRRVFTIGHSTRPIEEFIAMLTAQDVGLLVDVRTVPRSRHNPQFEGESLANSLPASGIRYRHQPGLGGFRRARPDSPNSGWRNASFRGYADYMLSPEFDAEVGMVIRETASGRLALMCAEAVPWRCHRSLIADALLVRDVASDEITAIGKTRPNVLTRFARVVDGVLTYPPDQTTVL
jgi:uncharacterized protein (DUF488 family)